MIIKKIFKSDVEFESCVQLCKAELKKNDGEGILSGDYIYKADYLLVALEKNKLLGYIAISNDFSMTEDKQYDTFFGNNEQVNGIYIEQILVNSNYQRQHIGTMLLNYLTQNEKNDIYSHVSIKNKVSLLFHIKNNFIPVGYFHNLHFYNVDNYYSLLLKFSSSVND